MNYFEYEHRIYSGDSQAMDAADSRHNDGKPVMPPSPDNAPKVIAEFSKKEKILSAEELIEHRKHCRARPGNCPFEKAVDEADSVSPNEIKITRQDVFNRLATVLTQLFQIAKNLAKPAIIDKEKIDEAKDELSKERSSSDSTKKVEDEAPEQETNADAKIVAEIIEGGISKMVELAKSKGCQIQMDDDNSKYIVKGPSRDSESH